MKLRNKKTGKRGRIAECNNYFIVVYPVNERWEADSEEKYVYYSISEFCEDWEDAKEPLIKDEKIRKAVRAWAEACEISLALVYHSFTDTFLTLQSAAKVISFQVETPKELKFGKTYTITELCGEEEE